MIDPAPFMIVISFIVRSPIISHICLCITKTGIDAGAFTHAACGIINLKDRTRKENIMPVTGAFMVPHPPIILPEVGHGEEKKIQKTTDSYEKCARRIAELSPETIVIASPHAPAYYDYFHISSNKELHGSMSQFRAGEVQFHESTDIDMVSCISRLAEKDGFAAGTLGSQDGQLDHGTMIPLYFIEKYFSGFDIVRVGLSGLPLEDHYYLGMLIRKAAKELDRSVVFVASGDLSHKYSDVSPYGFNENGPLYDERIMDVMGSGEFDRLFDFSNSFCESAAECGHRSFVIMAGALDRTEVKPKMLSHESPFGIGYGVCAYEIDGPAPTRDFLDQRLEKEQKRLEEQRSKEDPYVRLARGSVEAYVKGHTHIAVPSGLPGEMTAKAAGAFVSIHEHDRLRGCIGTIEAVRSNIAEEIIENAVSAASRDPRFPPIEKEELPDLEITVDILGKAEPLGDEDSVDIGSELDPKRYGVIVEKGSRQGLLLPNLDGVDTADEQIAIAKQKAGIGKEESGVMLSRFEVVRHY